MKIKLMLLNLSDNQFQLKVKSECTADDFSKRVLEFKLMYNKTRHRLNIKPVNKLHFTQFELDTLKAIVNGDNKELLNSLNSIANGVFNCNDPERSDCHYVICDYNGDMRYVS